jgi:hypothetical protein
MSLKMVDKSYENQGAMAWPTVAVRKIKGWTIEYNSYGGGQADADNGGKYSTFIRYDDGRIAYEWPERMPKFVLGAVARDLKTLMGKGSREDLIARHSHLRRQR